MDLNINIDADAVNKAVVDAIVKSAIGEQVAASVKRVMEGLRSSYNNPIDTVISSHVSAIVRDVLEKEYGATIREKIAEALKSKLSDEFIQRVVEKAADRYA
jgi:hypothetical protein